MENKIVTNNTLDDFSFKVSFFQASVADSVFSFIKQYYNALYCIMYNKIWKKESAVTATKKKKQWFSHSQTRVKNAGLVTLKT